MSGILGIVSREKSKYSKIEFKKMLDTLSHRGPDGEGYYFNQNVTLGYRRLQVFNSIGSEQPIANEDGKIRVICDGFIVNYKTLKKELVSKGHKFRADTDTEVIVHAYEEYGAGCLNYLNGFYSLAVLDERKRSILIARDRIGVRPLYYYFNGDELIFASEIKAIIKRKHFNEEVNLDGLNDYLFFQYCQGDKTLFKNINKILPGSYLLWNYKNSRSIGIKKYWDLEFNYDTVHTEKYFVGRLRSLLKDSVNLNLCSDAPIGAYLSGGIDSSSVVGIASRLLGNNRLKTFTGYYNEGKEYNEIAYAKLATRYIQGKNYPVPIKACQFTDAISKIVYFMDEPQAGPGVFGQFMVSKETGKHARVALSGEGGDEIFYGYAKYLIAYLEECIDGAIMETSDKGKYAVTLESIIPNLAILKAYKPLLKNFWSDGLFAKNEQRYFRLNSRLAENDPLLNRGFFEGCRSPFDEFISIFNSKNLASYINKMSYYDLKASLPAVLQVDDRTSMAFSIENRPPLLDYRIIELLASIPPAIKYKGAKSKYLLRKAVEGIIPERILQRKDKMGFPVPLNKWFSSGPLRDFTLDILKSRKAKKRGLFNIREIEKDIIQNDKFDRKLWGALNIELWFKAFID